MGLGVVPQLDFDVIPSPEGLIKACVTQLLNNINLGFDLSYSSTKLVLDSQRIDFVQEFDAGFINKLRRTARKYGVLFSGPSGNPLIIFELTSFY